MKMKFLDPSHSDIYEDEGLSANTHILAIYTDGSPAGYLNAVCDFNLHRGFSVS